MPGTERATKYQRITSHLLRGMALKIYDPQLPSENRLARKFNVSRMTARRAVDQLVHNGYAVRQPGRGTFVKTNRVVQGYFRVHPFSDHARQFAIKTGSRLIDKKLVSTDTETTRLFGCQTAMRVRRLHLFDGQPACFETRFLNPGTCAAIFDRSMENESIHDLLVRNCRLKLTKIVQKLEAMGLGGKTATFLEIDAGTPVFRMQQLVYSQQQAVSRVTYYLRSDLYTFEDTFEQYPDGLYQPGQGLGSKNDKQT